MLGNYFIDEITSEASSEHSYTDEVLLFGNYNLIYFTKENPQKSRSQLEELLLSANCCVNRNPTEILIKIPQETKNEIDTVELMRKQLKQKTKSYKDRSN